MSTPSANSHKKSNFSNLKTTRTAAIGLVAVVLLVASFMAGVSYQKGKHITTTATAAAQNRGFGAFGGGIGGGARRGAGFGSVAAVSPTSITVQSRSGASTTYSITSSTTVTNNGATAGVSDIQVGDTVAITRDATTTTQADRILLNPSFGGGPDDSQGASPGASTDLPTETN